jgi:hypothetical protein
MSPYVETLPLGMQDTDERTRLLSMVRCEGKGFKEVNCNIAMQKESPQSSFAAVGNRRRPRPMSMYFYDDIVNKKVSNLKNRLESACSYADEKTILRPALQILGQHDRARFNTYCSAVSRMLSFESEYRDYALKHFIGIVRSPDFFKLSYVDHLGRLTSEGQEQACYNLMLLNYFIAGRRNHPAGNNITNSDVEALCGIVSLIKSKCNGTSSISIEELAHFLAKRSFSFGVLPRIASQISEMKESDNIPIFVNQLNGTFA